MDELRRQLREAAEAHRPDRERMLARVERGMAASTADPYSAAGDLHAGRHRVRRGVLSWPRMVLAAVAATGVLAVGGLAVAAIAQRPQPQPAPTATPSAAPDTASPSAAPEALPAPTSASRAPSASPHRSGSAAPSASPSPSRPPATRPAGSRTEDGPLWADGSVDPHSTDSWAQSNVTFKTREVLTALTVELHVPQTGGVKDTGHWQTMAADDFTATVREEGGVLVYRWVLKAGRTVPVGQQVFAGQYGHNAGGRDAGGDWYRIDAATAGGRPSVWGDFARTG
ncbi:hypothetical protein BX265_0495 [Streptomyces sp. TLI_235]|nr:hypothetical protein [Streptomyces sp. TLI_235]PBC75815.1 hypothetical protein BX265_0495 [Streptomyces sp. TLI_235]